MSDTPRTDAAIREDANHELVCGIHADKAKIELARTLERELAEARANEKAIALMVEAYLASNRASTSCAGTRYAQGFEQGLEAGAVVCEVGAKLSSQHIVADALRYAAETIRAHPRPPSQRTESMGDDRIFGPCLAAAIAESEGQ